MSSWICCFSLTKSLLLHAIDGPSFSSLRSYLAALISTIFTAHWVLTGHWFSLDILALSMCVVMIGFIRFPNAKAIFLLFFGLLIYDVYWVFFSDVMVVCSSCFRLLTLVDSCSKRSPQSSAGSSSGRVSRAPPSISFAPRENHSSTHCRHRLIHAWAWRHLCALHYDFSLSPNGHYSFQPRQASERLF